jgi:hypothetical protein
MFSAFRPQRVVERASRRILRQAKRPTSYRPQILQLEFRVVPTISLTGGFSGMVNTGWNPPDTNIAVGPNHVLETVNESYAIYSKATGSLLAKNTLGSLFSGMDAGSGGQFDPTVLYDDLSGRFVIEAQVKDAANSASYVDIAVSNSSDPTQGFTEIHQIEVDEGGVYWTDNGKLGYNADAYVFTGNLYTFAGAFGHEVIVTVDKSSVLDQDASTLTSYLVDGPNIYSLIPARMHGSVAGGPMWFVATSPGGGNSVDVVAMENVLSSTPAFTDNNLTVNNYGLPPAAPQPDFTTVDTGDSRTLNVEWDNDYLVAAFNSASGADAAAAWCEFSTQGSNPTLLQQGIIHPGTGVATDYSSVGVDAAGDLALTYMESSSSEYASVYVTGRLASDPPGTLEPAVLAQSGSGTLLGRGGDYSGISPDPSAANTFWVGNEYGRSGTAWSTWLAQLQVTSPTGLDAPPTVATPAAAGTDPVTGTTTSLSVLGADDTGEAGLTYSWSMLSGPVGAMVPSFDVNGTNAAKTTNATFYQVGSYTFQVTITDPAGLTTTSSLTVAVAQTPTSLTVSPASDTLPNGVTQQFTAVAVDQFGSPLATQPSFVWSILPGGIGSIDSNGMYTSPDSGMGSAIICATAGTTSGTANVSVASGPAAPTALTATAASEHQIDLAWMEASTNVTGFTIARSSNDGRSWIPIAQVAGNITSYSDQTVNKGKTYQYEVAAYNSDGTSEWSSVVSVTTPFRNPIVAVGAYPAPDLPERIPLSALLLFDLSDVGQPTDPETSSATAGIPDAFGQPMMSDQGGQFQDQQASAMPIWSGSNAALNDTFWMTVLNDWMDLLVS